MAETLTITPNYWEGYQYKIPVDYITNIMRPTEVEGLRLAMRGTRHEPDPLECILIPFDPRPILRVHIPSLADIDHRAPVLQVADYLDHRGRGLAYDPHRWDVTWTYDQALIASHCNRLKLFAFDLTITLVAEAQSFVKAKLKGQKAA